MVSDSQSIKIILQVTLRFIPLVISLSTDGPSENNNCRAERNFKMAIVHKKKQEQQHTPKMSSKNLSKNTNQTSNNKTATARTNTKTIETTTTKAATEK